MTPNTRNRFYFPAWGDCCSANGWRMESGRLCGAGCGEPRFIIVAGKKVPNPNLDPTRNPSTRNASLETPASPELQKVLALARQRAAGEHRGLKLDDLRHAVHILCLGRDKSSDALTPSETDRVVAMFRLIQDPEDLDARLQVDAYARGEDPGALRRVEYVIRTSAPDAYVRAIAAARFGTRHWEELKPGQKSQLAMTLKERNKSEGRKKQRLTGTTAGYRAGGRVPAGEDHTHAAALNNNDPDWNV